jgi:hypothetical protein
MVSAMAADASHAGGLMYSGSPAISSGNGSDAPAGLATRSRARIRAAANCHPGRTMARSIR